MKPQITIIILLFLQLAYSQNKEIINPKGKWFFGVEIGSNEITSYTLGENKQSFQGGFLAEYYFAKHWSLSGRIKYFETGVSFYQPKTEGLFGQSERYGNFKGKVFSLPINLKWEFEIYQNFKGNLKVGASYNIETKSEYGNYSQNQNIEFPKNYFGFNSGIGLSYFINKKTAFFIDLEIHVGSSKGKTANFVDVSNVNTQNTHLNFGYKYSFQ